MFSNLLLKEESQFVFLYICRHLNGRQSYLTSCLEQNTHCSVLSGFQTNPLCFLVCVSILPMLRVYKIEGNLKSGCWPDITKLLIKPMPLIAGNRVAHGSWMGYITQIPWYHPHFLCGKTGKMLAISHSLSSHNKLANYQTLWSQLLLLERM